MDRSRSRTERNEDSDDRALVVRIGRGDRSALEQLYRRHAPWLTQRLENRCGDPELVDLAVQDTFLAVWKGARRYKGDGQVGAWIWGIGVRRLIDQLRKRKPTPLAPEVVSQLDPMFGPAGMGFEEALLDNGEHGSVLPALDALDPSLRAVLVATAVDGLSTKEAAVLLGIPRGTVKTRLMRARSQLQEALS